MTQPPQGRDGPPPVAALAVQVNTLRCDVESLAAKVGTFGRMQREHATALNDISELRHQVEQILAILTDQDDASPATWFWLRMSEQERNEKLSELSDWVETVFRAQYPDYLADQIKPCWPNHPEARWELAWLYHLWSAAYLAEHPAPKDTADWHDRWSPGVIRRLNSIMCRCKGTCQRLPGKEIAGDTRSRVSP
ncbi:MAG TPA: hypothetical protein VMV92_05845 [Streptosporangiaceae bacterium]|nr:hypothetical protein [Streptosporangiaceae bacterium]